MIVSDMCLFSMCFDSLCVRCTSLPVSTAHVMRQMYVTSMCHLCLLSVYQTLVCSPSVRCASTLHVSSVCRCVSTLHVSSVCRCVSTVHVTSVFRSMCQMCVYCLLYQMFVTLHVSEVRVSTLPLSGMCLLSMCRMPVKCPSIKHVLLSMYVLRAGVAVCRGCTDVGSVKADVYTRDGSCFSTVVTIHLR